MAEENSTIYTGLGINGDEIKNQFNNFYCEGSNSNPLLVLYDNNEEYRERTIWYNIQNGLTLEDCIFGVDITKDFVDKYQNFFIDENNNFYIPEYIESMTDGLKEILFDLKRLINYSSLDNIFKFSVKDESLWGKIVLEESKNILKIDQKAKICSVEKDNKINEDVFQLITEYDKLVGKEYRNAFKRKILSISEGNAFSGMDAKYFKEELGINGIVIPKSVKYIPTSLTLSSNNIAGIVADGKITWNSQGGTVNE